MTDAPPKPKKTPPKKGIRGLAARKPITFYGTLSVILVVGYVLWYGFQPLKGPIEVGICRTFAEMRLEYPRTFQMITYEPFERSTRLYYTYRGSFGENRSNMIDCRFYPEGMYPHPTLESVQINRVPQLKAQVEAFNRTIPAIIAAGPDLSIPYAYDGTMMDLKRD